jgi:hypothetical protein
MAPVAWPQAARVAGRSSNFCLTSELPFMAESFGSSFMLVEVTSDEGSSVPTRQMWLAFAKPDQALTLVLAQVPEGWTAEIVPAVLTEKQQRLFEEVNLRPGEVRRLTSE